MILDARKTPAQRRFNEPKIMENASRSSEPWADEDHHVEGILKTDPCSIYYMKSYCEKGLFLKKMVAEGPQFRVPSHMRWGTKLVTLW